MSGRPVLPVPVHHADGTSLLGPLRAALSGAGPAVAPHPAGTASEPVVVAPLGPDEDGTADPVAAVVSTTGSTGRAKHVLLPASALLASAAATHDRLGGAGRWLLAVPAHTVAGVQVLVRSLVAGTTPVVLDLADGFDPTRFAAATEHLLTGRPVRRYTSLVPTQLHRLLQAPADSGALPALRAYDAVLVGGAALDDRLRDQALDAGVAVVTTYGMTETCGGCVYDGVPLPGVTVALLDGVVVLGGPVLARGYRGSVGEVAAGAVGADAVGADAVAAQAVGADAVAADAVGAGDVGAEGGPPAEGFLDGPDGRRFVTADRGALREGRLVLHGRTDDVVVSGGTNVALDAVTRLVRGLPGVGDCLAVALPDEEWGQVVGLLVQPETGSRGPDQDVVRATVRDGLGRAAVPRAVVTVPVLPLTGVGKPDRLSAVRLLLAPGGARTPGLRDDGGPRTTPQEEPPA